MYTREKAERVLSPPARCPGRAARTCPGRGFGRCLCLERGCHEIEGHIRFLGCSDNLTPLLWSPVVSEITLGMVSSRAGYTATFSLSHSVISHLPSHSRLLLFAGQVRFTKNTILYQNMCKSQGKKYFSLQRGELENNSMNSNCNTITTTDC